MPRHLSIAVLLLLSPLLMAQEVSDKSIRETAAAFVEGYLGSNRHEISGIRELSTGIGREIIVVDLIPSGWLLMSRDYSASPVLAFSLTGTFVDPPDNSSDNRSGFLREYIGQLRRDVTQKSSFVNPGWDPSFYYRKSAEANEATVTVTPLIKVTWNQNSGWNRFCPEDENGPGGHVYAGCVAVSMAQAMSVFGVPSQGMGSNQYDHPVYGSISADFSAASYDWENMRAAVPDDNNAFIIFHCAVSVEMDFSPDGSGAVTIAASTTAMKEFFYYSKKMAFTKRGTDTEAWKDLLDKSLAAGNPIVYSGFPETGSSGHAFNIDGVHKSNYYHINWGWSGIDDGYYTIDNLKPGGSDFTQGHTAIFGIQPYYYPTDIALSDTLVLLDRPAGEGVAHFSVVDEATDNTYEITLECDSSLVGTELIPDYYLDGDSLRTSRPFERADGPVDTVIFIVKDVHGNEIRASKLLLLTASLSAGDGEQPDSFNVYPVPLKDHFIITFPPGKTRIRITNLRGTEVASVIEYSGRITMPSSGMPPGIYVITVTDSSGRQHSKTVVKN